METRRISTVSPYILDGSTGNAQKKMLKKYVRSRNVYENKQNMDKMPDEKSGIYVDMTRVLQKNAPYDGHVPGQFAFLRFFSCIIQCLQS